MMEYIPWALAIVFFVAFLYERKRRRVVEKKAEEAKRKHQNEMIAFLQMQKRKREFEENAKDLQKQHQAELIAKLEEVNARFEQFEKTMKERFSASQDRKDYPMFFDN